MLPPSLKNFILLTAPLCAPGINFIGYPEFMSHIAKEPPLSPDTHKLLLHANSTTASLWPLNKPYRHVKVSKFQTSKLASYDEDIPTLF